ncbi:MAG: hypothetical protein Q9N67_06120 [Ghiorsea sp.]|nr:hypothetical protein [Ghiorsea sp.]
MNTWFLITSSLGISLALTLPWIYYLYKQNKDLRQQLLVNNDIVTTNITLEQQLRIAHQQLEQQKQQLSQCQIENKDVMTSLTQLKTERQLVQQHHREKLALLEDAKIKLAHEFKSLSNQIFEENTGVHIKSIVEIALIT